MFDGVPEQFHQFIRSNSQSSLPLHHLPFPNNTPFLDPSLHHHQFHQLVQHNNLLHPLHSSSSSSSKHEEKQENNTNNTTLPLSFEIIDEERDHDHQKQQLPELIDPWSNEEVLTLLRIRSSMDSWFPERTWEHISRKMAEVGYKRSAEKCKEKFEEESRFFTNNINNNNNNNYGKSSSSTSYRFLSELEELYHHQEVVVESDQKNHHQNNNNHASDEGKKQQEEEVKIMDHHALGGEEEEGDLGKVNTTSPPTTKEERSNNNKRKRGGGGRFEMFKGYCESIVHKMMEQQEEMHNKLIEDMVRWDEERFAREEAWKRQEIERMNKELDIMAQEQAIAGDRHASIVDFLTKFAPQIQDLGLIGGRDKLVKVTTNNVNGSNTELHSHQNPNPSSMENSLQPTNSISVAKENPSSSGTHHAQDTLLQVGIMNPSSSSSLVNNDPIETNSSVANKATTTEKDEIGRRWPKDEVLALINLRCTTQNNNNNEDNSNKEGNNNNNKAPLWERISQGMMELGYKRSAKRCKEKWENINKYFRKTKDVNKKRSLDSRTCPYFHYLTNLYSQGKLVLQPPERSQKIIPAQMHQIPYVVIDNNQNQTQLVDETTSSQVGSGGEGLSMQKVDHGGEKTLMQVPSLDFDQF